MGQRVRELAALGADQRSSSTPIVAHTVLGDPTPSSDFCRHQLHVCAHKYVQAKYNIHKIDLKAFKGVFVGFP